MNSLVFLIDLCSTTLGFLRDNFMTVVSYPFNGDDCDCVRATTMVTVVVGATAMVDKVKRDERDMQWPTMAKNFTIFAALSLSPSELFISLL